MSRTSPVHYIAPSAISITPNCNSSANDISVYLARGAKIGVYSPRAGIDYVDAQAQTWTLRGRNRRLADSTKPYTIYARLSKTDYTNGYLVFASKNQQGGVWYDKYNYITPLGLSDVTGATTSADYWYVRLGDVSVPSQAERTLSYDTGILGTTLFNTEWGVDPDSLPLRIDVSCTIGGEDAGVNPYVYWGGQLALTAQLVEGWIGTTLQRFTRWSIARDTGDSTADAAWQNTQKVQDFATTGTIELTHQRGAGEVDDFNGAVSTFFTITAWGAAEDGSAQDVVLVQTTVNILAETVEGFQIVCSTEFMSYNPQTHAYTPSDGVKVCLRATDQRGDVTDMTTAQIAAAQLTASYAEVGGSSWTALSFSNVGGIATATVPASAFQNGKSINVRLVNADSKELARRTIAYVKDGEDSKLREWIFLRSATEITFGTQDHPYPASISGGEVNPTGAAGDIDTNKNQDGWVPQGWWDEQRGTTQSERYEYGAYRNYIQATSTTPAHWGDFTKPSLWSHYGQNGIDAQDVEWAYIRTKTTVPPLIDDDANYTDHNNKAYTADGHLPKVKAGSGGQLSDIEPNNSGSGSKLYECTANPKGVNDDWPYEWEIKRTKGAADATSNKRAWNAYSGSLVLRTDPAFNKYISTILGGATGNATTVANAQKAVLGALDGTTVTDNGLMLTSLIALRKLRRSDLDPTVLENYDTWGGVSGMYNADAKGYGLAAWYGGDMIDREAVQESHASDVPAWVEPAWGTGYRYAKSVDRFDGSGYRAGGNISWDASGNVTIKGTVIRDATYYVGNQDVTDILKLFRKVRVGGTDAEPLYMIEAAYGLYALGDIQALGYSPSQGGGGGGASVLYELNDVSPNADNNAVLGIVIDDQNPQGDGYVLTYDYNSKHWIAAPAAETYRLPQATSQALGGIKIGYTSGQSETRNYAVALDADGRAYVNVPWVSGSFGTEGTDNIEITLGTTTKTVLTHHQSLSGYATQQWVNDKGYITSSGSCNYANSAGAVAWNNVSGRPTAVSSFTNDSGYITSAGSCNYANSAGYATSAGSASDSSRIARDGDTMTGTLGLRSHAYGGPNGDHGLNCNNSDIVGVNSIYTNDTSDGWDEGIEFKRSNDNWDSLYAHDGSFYFMSNNGGSYANLYVNYLYANSDVQVTSDERRKDVIGDVQLSVEQIAQMPSVLFRWKKGFGDDQIHVGTIAQSWEKVLPAVVGIGTDDDRTRSFSYSAAAYAMAHADACEIEALKKRVSKLEAELKRYKTA